MTPFAANLGTKDMIDEEVENVEKELWVGDDKNIWEFLHPAAYCQGGTYSFKNTPFSSSISYIFLGFGGKKQKNGTFEFLEAFIVIP